MYQDRHSALIGASIRELEVMQREVDLMSHCVITVPSELVSALKEGLGTVDLPRWALEALVLEALRQGLNTRGHGGKILGLGFHEREAFYARRGIVYDLDDEAIEREQADRARVFPA